MDENKLKQDILSALGTCAFLEQESGWPAKDVFIQELYSLLARKYGKEAARTKLEQLLPDIPHAQPEDMPFGPSQILEEFTWLDRRFQQQDPAYPNLNQNLIRRIYETLGISQTPDVTLPESACQLLDELDAMTGLSAVKQQVHRLAALARISQVRKSNGLKVPVISHHLVFEGNPGTGKTTIARLIAKLYRELGLLSKGQLVEVSRPDLVAGYVGQSALKTEEKVRSALGGVLFIDEAYSLAKPSSPNDFGQEAIETLLKMMEDHRQDLCVIAAGYPDQMETFLASNPGLRSRFGTTLHFEDYTPAQLTNILVSMAYDMDYTLSNATIDWISHKLQQQTNSHPSNFGNGRTVRTWLEAAIARQAERLVSGSNFTDLQELLIEDFPEDIQL